MSRRTAAFPKIKMKIREKEAANMSRRTADETLSQQISAYTRRGLYRKKIFRVFFAISFVFILCFLILVSSFFSAVQRLSLRSSYQNEVTAHEQLLSMSTQNLQNTISRIEESSILEEWATSPIDQKEYFFYATRLYELLRQSSSTLSGIDYEIGLWKEGSFVLSSDGSIAMDDFFSVDNSGLSMEEWQAITSALDENQNTVTVPVYRNSALEKLYYVQATHFNEVTVYIWCCFPATNFLSGTHIRNVFILPIDRDELISATQDATLSVKDFSLLPDTQLSLNSTIWDDYYSFFCSPFQWNIIYQYHYSFFSNFSEYALGWLVMIIAVSLACTTVFSILAHRLYFPVEKVLSGIKLSKKKQPFVDEFELISSELNASLLLSEQLQAAESQNLAHQKRQYYTELLYMVPDGDCPLSLQELHSYYCVAIIELYSFDVGDENSWKQYIQKSQLLLAARRGERKNIYGINQNYNTVALILPVDTEQKARDLMKELFSQANLESGFKIALSENKELVIHICECYRQALHLLEYRHLVQDSGVITVEHTKTVTQNYYYYPLTLENNIIRMVASGSTDFEKVYNTLIEENTINHPLSVEGQRNFVHALVDSLMRVFQELKTTPYSLLGHEIDFQSLYDGWQSKGIFDILRDRFYEIANVLSSSVDAEHQNLLQQMQQFIYQHYSEDIMLFDIAEHCGISTSYCSTLFKKLSNDNFKAFLNRYRIQRACEVLDENPSVKISDLSNSVGFNSANSFIRAFKQAVGVTPKAYSERALNWKSEQKK